MIAPSGPVVVLAGGTGGAKLARGMLDAVGDPSELVVVANTGDDLEIYGAHVSPDPDLVTFWLADRIDERGWGLADDTFAVMDGLRELGAEIWFKLGDRDLALGIERARRLHAGERLTEVHTALATRLGVRARVLPMCDAPVRTRVTAAGTAFSLQEYLIREHGREDIQDIAFRGAGDARPAPEALGAIAAARAIVIGPSNPILSIGPILAVPGYADALRAARAPVVAVSPIVAGKVLKGPTAACLRYAGQPVSAAGAARVYAGLLDGVVADEPVAGLPTLETDLLMESPGGRRRLAAETLAFALALALGGEPTG